MNFKWFQRPESPMTRVGSRLRKWRKVGRQPSILAPSDRIALERRPSRHQTAVAASTGLGNHTEELPPGGSVSKVNVGSISPGWKRNQGHRPGSARELARGD